LGQVDEGMEKHLQIKKTGEEKSQTQTQTEWRYFGL
jgi:hypothetical protein